MKISLDIASKHLKELDRICEANQRSRAAIVREAIALYVAARRPGCLDDAFGLWGDRKADGAVYQKKLRSEW
jgi:predicted transcriptional regulator